MDTLEKGTVLQDRYIIEKVIGQGGMSAIYLAHDKRLTDKVWAVKELSPDFSDEEHLEQVRKHFEQEANILAKLDYPSLPQVFDYFSYGNKNYLVMDYIEGETLAEYVAKQNNFIDVEKVIQWALSICDVLFYLHSQQPNPIIFRDLKPENIMLTKDNRIKLIDFGIARVFSEEKDKDTIIIGTPGFAAPEQYGRGQTTPRSDIYSLGATLFYLLTLQDPADTGFIFPPVSQINKQVSPALAECIAKALSLEPDKRYQSAREFKEALLKAINLQPKITTPQPAVPSTAPVLQTQYLQKNGKKVINLGIIKQGTSKSIFITQAIDERYVKYLKTNRDWLKCSWDMWYNKVKISVDTKNLDSGGTYKGNVNLKIKDNEEEIEVIVTVKPRLFTVSLTFFVFLLLLASLIPGVGFVALIGMISLYLSKPSDLRKGFKIPLFISIIFVCAWVFGVMLYFLLLNLGIFN